ncbi:hypothetical protein HMPREF9103_01533 [Lentilactobacillus parafarraginis F0439]|uniref:Uncharacterized protein n=1 Tax=Lentilactobacillus parafarraginis F0439 TaxID=797515 RepID=G9ZP79_9LACO|nr:hypothetical protein HMPREF9103_01533 [Lentilactobacillus parafarraginis F0439]
MRSGLIIASALFLSNGRVALDELKNAPHNVFCMKSSHESREGCRYEKSG